MFNMRPEQVKSFQVGTSMNTGALNSQSKAFDRILQAVGDQQQSMRREDLLKKIQEIPREKRTQGKLQELFGGQHQDKETMAFLQGLVGNKQTVGQMTKGKGRGKSSGKKNGQKDLNIIDQAEFVADEVELGRINDELLTPGVSKERAAELRRRAANIEFKRNRKKWEGMKIPTTKRGYNAISGKRAKEKVQSNTKAKQMIRNMMDKARKIKPQVQSLIDKASSI